VANRLIVNQDQVVVFSFDTVAVVTLCFGLHNEFLSVLLICSLNR